MAAPTSASAALSADPKWVAEQFVSKYYDVLEKHPKYVHRFYKDTSTFTVSDMEGQATSETAQGNLEVLQEKIMATIAGAVVVAGKHVDAQFSFGSGVLLQVSGIMQLRGMDRRFVQTFFLATQEKGYYVLNDIIRLFPVQPAVPAAPEAVRPLENGFMPHIHVPFTMPPPPAMHLLPPQPVIAPAHAAAAPVVPAAAVPSPAVSAPAHAAAAPVAPAPAPVAAEAVPVAEAHDTASTATSSKASHSQPSSVPASNLSWSERVKLAQNTPQKAAPAPAPAAAQGGKVAAAPAQEGAEEVAKVAAAAPQPADAATAAAVVDEAAAASKEAQDAAAAVVDPDAIGVYVKELPQPGASRTVAQLKEMINAEFSKFGQIRPDTPEKEGLSLVWSKRFGYVAYIRFESEAGMKAAMDMNNKLVLDGQKLTILKISKEFADGPAPGGRGDRGAAASGRGSGRGGENTSGRSGRGGFEGGRGGRGGRSEGGRGERGSFAPRGGRSEGRGRGPAGGRGRDSAPRAEGGRGTTA